MNHSYADYAATTPMDPRVLAEMIKCLTGSEHLEHLGNPASTHRHGAEALKIVEKNRCHVADLIGAQPEEILWTAGATESDNLAIKGVAEANSDRGRHIITAAAEHKAVLDSCGDLEQKNFEVTYLFPATDGSLDLDELQNAIRPDTILVSIMHVNNETGFVNDIAAIGRMTQKKGVPFHVDGAQGVGKLPIDVHAMGVDLMSISTHKVYGPQGTGALFRSNRSKVKLKPQMHGGGHEKGFRSGTLAPHQIAGTGEACRLAAIEMDQDLSRLYDLRSRFQRELSKIDGLHYSLDPELCYPGIISFRIDGIKVRKLMKRVNHSFASGSACNSASVAPSHVLKAIGLDDEAAANSLRISFGRFSTVPDVTTLAQDIILAVEMERSKHPARRFDEYGMYLAKTT